MFLRDSDREGVPRSSKSPLNDLGIFVMRHEKALRVEKRHAAMVPAVRAKNVESELLRVIVYECQKRGRAQGVCAPWALFLEFHGSIYEVSQGACALELLDG